MKCLFAALCLLWTGAVANAAADLTGPIGGGGPGFGVVGLVGSAGAPPPSYTGPGDVVSGASAWYGLRAYNAAYATGSNKAINIRRASDNTTQDIVILTSGALDIASANTFAGTDASCTGSMVGTTTLTISACSSGTLKVNDTLTAVGATGPFYITAIGTCGAPPGTCTVNAAQTFASEAVTAQVAMFVTEAYDQTGNGVNITQATAANQPQLLPSCVNSLPCLVSGTNIVLTGGTIGASAQPWSMSAVGNALSGGQKSLISTGTSFQPTLGMTTASTGGGTLFAGNIVVGGPATAGAWHAIAGIANGASSIVIADGIATSSLNAGADTLTAQGTNVNIGTGVQNALIGYYTEAGIWPLGFNSTQYGNLCHNQFSYWGTAVSC